MKFINAIYTNTETNGMKLTNVIRYLQVLATIHSLLTIGNLIQYKKSRRGRTQFHFSLYTLLLNFIH